MANPITALKDTFMRGGAGDGDEPITAGRIRDRWDASQRAAAKERQAFWINSAFVGNEQWVTWETHNDHLIQVPPDGDRMQATENRLWPSVRTLASKLLKRPLVFEVPPTSADDASQDGSRTAAAILTDVHGRHQWEQLRHSAALLALKGGLSVLCVEWDAKAGTPLGATETGKHFGTGDTVDSVLSVIEVATEPGVRDIETAPYWIKGAALPPRIVKEMFDLDEEPAADASAGLSPLQRSLLAGSGGSSSDVKLTLVLTYYERPCPAYPQGQVATVVGSSIVDGGVKPWPFPFKDKLNCVVVRETPHEQDWLADTILSAAISPQRMLNHAVSKIGEHMKLAADARFAVPDGAGDEWDDLSDVPEVVRYPGDKLPAWVSAPEMPQWWITAPDRAKKAIDDILGVHDISRGDSPSGVTAGIALSLLAEQDDTPLGLLAKEMAEAWGRFASLTLAIYEAKVTEERTATVARPGQAPERVTWSGADLQGQTTAVVPLTAVAPRSDAAQLEMAFRVKGTFPELDLKTWAKIANLPDAGDLTEAVDPDVAKAQRENGEMAAGNIVIPSAFDDHAKHIHEHNTFRKSARYEALEGSGDLQNPTGPRDIIDAHVQGHEVEAAREMATQLAKAQVNPALAAAAQASEPPMAGGPGALQQMQAAHDQGVASAPDPMAGGAVDGADGQAVTQPAPGQ